MYPRKNHRDPEEYYDHIYRPMPDEPTISRIIDHPRKLVIHNSCANPYIAVPEEIDRERTCYDYDEEEVFDRCL